MMVRLFSKLLRSKKSPEKTASSKKAKADRHAKCSGSASTARSPDDDARNEVFAPKRSMTPNFLRRAGRRLRLKNTHPRVIDFDALPIIDRVPTAYGYHSSDSDADWSADSSQSTKYAFWEDEQNVFPVEVDVEEDETDNYDFISEMDDRYSHLDSFSSSSDDYSDDDDDDDDDDSFASFEDKVGSELQRQRERLRANIIRHLDAVTTPPKEKTSNEKSAR